jgi:hypothetical protein
MDLWSSDITVLSSTCSLLGYQNRSLSCDAWWGALYSGFAWYPSRSVGNPPVPFSPSVRDSWDFPGDTTLLFYVFDLGSPVGGVG